MEENSVSKEAEYLGVMVEKQGVVCATVKDGHVLIFNRQYLRKVVESGDSETFLIFVKKGELQ